MNKFGVAQNHPSSKQAADSSTCPRCGQTVHFEGRLRLCPTHGSEPFEATVVNREEAPRNNDADDDGA